MGCWTASSPDGNSCLPVSCAMRSRRSRRPGASPNATSLLPSGHARGSARGSAAQTPPRSRPGGAVPQLDQLRGHGHCRGRCARLCRADGLPHHRRRRARSAVWRSGDLLPAARIYLCRHRGGFSGHVLSVDPVADAQAAVVRALSQVGPQSRRGKKGSAERGDRSGDHFGSGDLWKWPGLCLHGRRAVLRRRLPFDDAGVHHLLSIRRTPT